PALTSHHAKRVVPVHSAANSSNPTCAVNTMIPRLSIRVVVASSLWALGSVSLAQDQPVAKSGVQPATVPAPMVYSPRTGNMVIQPLNPSRPVNPSSASRQMNLNPSATTTFGSSPSATTTFQSQTPLTGGTPQATLSFTPQSQQFEQPAVTAGPLGIPY